MDIIKWVLANGFLPLIPIFVWNAVFTSKLPESFRPQNMDLGVPRSILTGENVLRAAVFILPLLFKLDITSPTGKLGLAVYVSGCFIYFVSWLLVIYAPGSVWSKSMLGFAAPAYTTVIWLAGISLMSGSYNVGIPFSRWHYIIVCVLFAGVHTAHSVWAYMKAK